EPAADQPLDGEKGVLRVCDGLSLGGLSDKALAVCRERHDGWGCPAPFRIFDDLGGRTLHNGHTRIGRAEVDTNHFSHVVPLRRRMVSWPSNEAPSGPSPLNSLAKPASGRYPCQS